VIVKNNMKQFFIKGSYSFIKKEYILKSKGDFPLMINIEPTLACNLKCYMCPSHSEELKHLQSRKVGFLDFNLFKKIIDECALHEDLLVLNMHKDGESSLHPKFAEMLEYAKYKQVAKIIHFNTNCLMSHKVVDDILRSGVDDITLSIDATNADLYKKIKGVDKFDEVIETAKYFYKKRDELKAHTFIRVKMILSNLTRDYKEEFLKQWENIADEVQFQNIHNFSGALDSEQTISSARYACLLPFYSMAINWNGKVPLCHRDFNEDDIMGDVNKETIYKIYNNEKYQLYRKKLLMNDVDDLSMCKNCDSWATGINLNNELKTKYGI
jgi:radical SAM protein with 4Fe4S-binding SPASM domain